MPLHVPKPVWIGGYGGGERFLVVWIFKHGRPTRRFDMEQTSKRGHPGRGQKQRGLERARLYDMLLRGGGDARCWMGNGTEQCKGENEMWSGCNAYRNS